MTNQISVKSGPQEFICQVGSWQLLPQELLKRDLDKVLVLHGKESWAVAEKHFPLDPKINFIFQTYRKPCSDMNINYFAEEAERLAVKAIIAVGGGRVSDLAKGVGNQLDLPVIMLPTLASTCAAYTPLSVIYDDEGRLERMDYYSRAITLTLVDPEIILDSPTELLVAGIGDTLAKWYEADGIISSLKQRPLEVEVAYFAAKKCQEVLLKQSASAIIASQTQMLNQAFIDVVETIIMLAGLVGGFGDSYGRSSGAHSIHDALTVIPEAHTQLHGRIVSYGILVQLIIEDKWDELENLLPFYQEIGLATSLTDLNLNLTLEEVELISEKATEPGEPIYMLPVEISQEVVFHAILALEKFRSEA